MFIKFCRENFKFSINVHLKVNKIKINFLASLSKLFPVLTFLTIITKKLEIVFQIFSVFVTAFCSFLNNTVYSVVGHLVSQVLN